MHEHAAAQIEVKNGVAFVFAHSGQRLTVADHEAFSVHLDFPPAELALGAAVRQALEASRFIDSTKIGQAAWERFMFEEARARHDDWFDQALLLTGSKSEKNYLEGLKACALLRIGDRVKLSPTLDGAFDWGNPETLEDVLRYCPIDASDELIQASVLESLELAR
jgi:CDI immunity protein